MSQDMGQRWSTIKDSPVPYSHIRFSCLFLPEIQVSVSPLPVSLSLHRRPEVYRPLICYHADGADLLALFHDKAWSCCSWKREVWKEGEKVGPGQ